MGWRAYATGKNEDKIERLCTSNCGTILREVSNDEIYSENTWQKDYVKSIVKNAFWDSIEKERHYDDDDIMRVKVFLEECVKYDCGIEFSF